MDIQRYLLIAASFVLTLMLLTEWTAFKAEQTPKVERVSKLYDTINEDMATSTAVASDLALTKTDSALPEDDLPQVSVATPSADIQPSTNDNRYVQLQSETLHITVDLLGGDIVEASLPQFPEALDKPDTPFILLEQSNQRMYVAQSGLVGPDGVDKGSRARYQVATGSGTAASATDQLTLTHTNTESAITVRKTFGLAPSSNLVNITFDIANNGATAKTVVPFGQIKRDGSEPPGADTTGFGLQPFLGAATTTDEDRFRKFDFEEMREDPYKGTHQGGWIAMLQHYFLSAWIPDPTVINTFSTRQTRAGFNIAGFTSPAITIEPGQTASYTAQLYVGPKDQYRLAALSPHLDLTVDYGWLWWIAQPLFWLLTKIQSLVSNWGVAIIILTVLIKGAFSKLSAASYRSMAKMRQVQPKMLAIREQYSTDKQKQNQAMMALYQKEKINPMGGCLPILVQMPVFIALYWVLMESVELRQAPFALWIEDLSVMDPYFVLPIIMGASMYFMQKLNPPPPDPMQAKIMQWLPVAFTFLFLWFPAGLVLYWVANNLLSMSQQWYITRALEREGLSR